MSETTNKQFLDKNGLVAFWNKIMSTVTNIITSKLEEYLSTIDVDLSMHIAWSDLVALRNNSQLTPGKKYRIIDYVTTTAQENTSSANHPFDIIVTAIDEHTLSENASAIRSDRDTDNYFGTENLEAWQLKYCLDNDTERFAWADNSAPKWYSKIVANYIVDQSGTHSYSLDKEHYIYDFGTMPHPDTGYDTLVFYTQDPIYYEETGADYTDIYFYNGITNVDGVEYDSWRKFDENGSYWVNPGGDNGGLYALTERVIYNGQFVWPDNTGVENGKGVIYNMIDEYGNECPYDFKNIQFKRGVYDGGGIAPDGDEDMYIHLFTFSFRTENNEIIDTSIFGNNGRLLNDEGQITGVYGNVIGQYMTYDGSIDSPTKTTQWLNEIVFYSFYDYDNGLYYGCYGNTFGNSCYNNSFGNSCYSNSFGNSCYSNSFGNSCYSNSFGNSCSNNSFGNDCYSNSFGNDCHFNSFGNTCSYNSFGNACSYNSFGNYCYSNSFGNSCSNNSFGNTCSYNSFENSCGYNSFRTSPSTTGTLKDYCYNNSFDDGCSYNVIWNNIQSTYSNILQRINIVRGVSGTSSAYNYINIVDKKAAYEIKVAKNSKGEIKIYCEADLIK